MSDRIVAPELDVYVDRRPTLAQSRITRRARDFYAIYCASSGGLNFQGQPCPPWYKLTDAVRGHWTVVALRSIQLNELDLLDDSKLAGQEAEILPTSAVIGHLGEAQQEQAIETWTKYSAQIFPIR